MKNDVKTELHLKLPRLLVVTLFVLFVAVSNAGADDLVAVIEETEGTVEVQLEGQSWEPAEVGAVVPIAARISTGFGASAVLAVGENARLRVSSLTRVTIDELALDEGVERSELNLEVGRIQGEVQGADVDDTEFDLRSPVATASVRGTSFDFDGRELSVTSGQIAFEGGVLGREVTIRQQETSSTDGIEVQDGGSGRANRGAVRHQTESGDDDAARDDDRGLIEDPATVTVRFGGLQ